MFKKSQNIWAYFWNFLLKVIYLCKNVLWRLDKTGFKIKSLFKHAWNIFSPTATFRPIWSHWSTYTFFPKPQKFNLSSWFRKNAYGTLIESAHNEKFDTGLVCAGLDRKWWRLNQLAFVLTSEIKFQPLILRRGCGASWGSEKWKLKHNLQCRFKSRNSFLLKLLVWSKRYSHCTTHRNLSTRTSKFELVQQTFLAKKPCKKSADLHPRKGNLL
jgi:hypothetical protein